jgi:hypothetical protein
MHFFVGLLVVISLCSYLTVVCIASHDRRLARRSAAAVR